MITERQAKQGIINAWKNWGAKTGARGDKRAFYEWLKANQPHLLTFKCAGDRWQVINIWLLKY